MIRSFVCGAAALSVSAGLVTADISGGILTADVEITADVLFGGASFAAVINPDAVDNYPGGTGPVNMSGYLHGPVAQPFMFFYVDLPVYAILDAAGAPIAYDTQLFGVGPGGEPNFQAPLFTLSQVGTLTFDALHTGLNSYDAAGGFETMDGRVINLFGDARIECPPGGQPSFLWYGMGADALALFGDQEVFDITSNDAQWMDNGWPGVTLDK
ncbi:MAG: hypothetical protein K8E66_13375, partial [Phycisphaerales bacterium]|nr:hypothetical protein [Phycisphaerales bacterium]